MIRSIRIRDLEAFASMRREILKLSLRLRVSERSRTSKRSLEDVARLAFLAQESFKSMIEVVELGGLRVLRLK